MDKKMALVTNVARVAAFAASFMAVKMALTPIINAVDQLSTLASKQDKIFKKLETQVDKVGVSYKSVEGQLKRTFATLQAITQYGDTEQAEALQRIILLTGNYEKAVANLPLVLDIASTGFLSMNDAARTVAFAMEGNTMALTRIDPKIKEMMKSIDKTATVSELAAIFMGKLRDQFGGQAQRNVADYESQITQLNNTLDDLKEKSGKAAIAIKIGFVSALKEASLEVDEAGGTIVDYYKYIASFLIRGPGATGGVAPMQAEIARLIVADVTRQAEAVAVASEDAFWDFLNEVEERLKEKTKQKVVDWGEVTERIIELNDRLRDLGVDPFKPAEAPLLESGIRPGAEAADLTLMQTDRPTPENIAAPHLEANLLIIDSLDELQRRYITTNKVIEKVGIGTAMTASKAITGEIMKEGIMRAKLGRAIVTGARQGAAAELESLAIKSGARAIYETALGIATIFTQPAESATHFTAAGILGAKAIGFAAAGSILAPDAPKGDGYNEGIGDMGGGTPVGGRTDAGSRIVEASAAPQTIHYHIVTHVYGHMVDVGDFVEEHIIPALERQKTLGNI